MNVELRWFFFLTACVLCLTGATCLEALTQGYVPVDEAGKPVAGAEPVSLLSLLVPTVLSVIGLRGASSTAALLCSPQNKVMKFVTGLLGGSGLRTEGLK